MGSNRILSPSSLGTFPLTLQPAPAVSPRVAVAGGSSSHAPFHYRQFGISISHRESKLEKRKLTEAVCKLLSFEGCDLFALTPQRVGQRVGSVRGRGVVASSKMGGVVSEDWVKDATIQNDGIDYPPPLGTTLGSLWESKTEVEDGMFDWTMAWYPVAIAHDMDKKRPLQVTVLGRQYVVWWDRNSPGVGGVEGGQWQVFADLCPHRLAPLSDGRIHESGALQCSYHGWTFLGDASCSSIPQAPAGGPNMHGMPQACAIRHPVRVRYGIVWMIPSSGPKAWKMARESEPPAIPVLDDPSFQWTPGMRDLAYGYDTLVENVVDPSHVPFAHHGIQGNRNSPRPVNIVVQEAGVGGFSGETGTGIATFRAPCTYVQEFRIPKKDRKGYLIALFVPTTPGNSRLFWIFPVHFARTLVRLKPTWFDHITNRLAVTDSDLYLLHYQERAAASMPELKKRLTAYYIPTKADGFVSAFRKWYEKFAGGTPPWAPGVDTRLPPMLPKEILLDRYNSHVAHCAACRGALDNFKRLQVGLQVAALAILAGLVADVATGSSVVAHSWVLPLLGLGALLLLLSKALDSVIEGFHFKDYIHAYVK